ncbi:hypothetical protein [Schlesneria paludicola]|uniref:hypothetical protein n=1 Tax=Schlesneria paludicola TaxID=360056 RepID=UPI00029A45D0|nr:hypothetical protein [Schlesneria paludicola]
MLDACLLALICLADPSVANFDASNAIVNGMVPSPTCARPIALMFEIRASCAAASIRPLKNSAVDAYLNRWEQGSRERPVCSRFLREEFRRLNDGVNEHTLTAAEVLSGPVTAKALHESYSWQIHSISSDRICLEGVPREAMESLFYRSIQVTFQMTESVPEQIVILGRDSQQRTVWNWDRVTSQETVAFANFINFESEVPPAPTAIRQTASRVLE